MSDLPNGVFPCSSIGCSNLSFSDGKCALHMHKSQNPHLQMVRVLRVHREGKSVVMLRRSENRWGDVAFEVRTNKMLDGRFPDLEAALTCFYAAVKAAKGV